MYLKIMSNPTKTKISKTWLKHSINNKITQDRFEIYFNLIM